MKRRAFLRTAAVSIVGFPRPVVAERPRRIVDTHTHFYDPKRPQGVPWPSKGSPLYRPVLPADWQKVASPHGVTETVVVEASPWVEDNQWVLDVAVNEKSIVGFIGNLTPTDAGWAGHLKRFAANPLFRGIRWPGDLIQLEAAREQVKRGANEMSERGLVLELNGKASILAEAARMAAELPDLTIVIDHLGGAGDAVHLTDEWRQGMKTAGKRTNIFLKVSALMEQTDESARSYGQAPRDTAHYEPLLDHCWECFGEDRVVYGSNWPVSEKGGTYGDQFKIVSEYFAAQGSGALEKYLWKNSLAAYRWNER